MVDVIVIGAGTAGLACAHALQQAGTEVLVLEGRPRAGGDARTIEVGEFLFETGPWAVRSGGSEFDALVEELGLAHGLVRSTEAAARWYAWKDGMLWPVPQGPAELLRSPLLSLRGRLRALVEPVVVGPDDEYPEVESDLREFLVRRLGDEAGGLFAELIARTTHGAAAGELGVSSAFPELSRGAAGRLGVVRDLLAGEGSTGDEVVSFHGGLSALVEALVRALGSALSTSSPVAELERGAGGWRVTLEGGEALSAKQVVLAVPAAAAYPLLAMCAPARLEIDELRTVEHERIANVHLGLDGAALLPGRGIVSVPGEDSDELSADRPAILGAVFHSNLFPGRAPTGTAAVSCSYKAADVEGADAEDLARGASRDLARMLGHDREPPAVVASFVRAIDVPRLGVGHADRMEHLLRRLRRALPGLFLTGSYLGGIGVASRVAHARRIASAIARSAS